MIRRAGQSGEGYAVSAAGSSAWLKPGAAAEVAGELVVEDVGADMEQEAGAAGYPAHLLLFDHALASDDLGRPPGHPGVGETTVTRHDRAARRRMAPCRSQCRETMSGKLRRSSRVPHLTGLDVPRWRPGTTITDGRTDARLRG